MVGTDVERGTTTVRTTTLQETLTELLLWARAQSVVLADLDATTASLESVFLSFTDRPHQPTEDDTAPTREEASRA